MLTLIQVISSNHMLMLQSRMVALTSFPPPTEGITCQEPNTQAHVGSKLLGSGTLFIAER